MVARATYALVESWSTRFASQPAIAGRSLSRSRPARSARCSIGNSCSSGSVNSVARSARMGTVSEPPEARAAAMRCIHLSRFGRATAMTAPPIDNHSGTSESSAFEPMAIIVCVGFSCPSLSSSKTCRLRRTPGSARLFKISASAVGAPMVDRVTAGARPRTVTVRIAGACCSASSCICSARDLPFSSTIRRCSCPSRAVCMRASASAVSNAVS